jgi:hypothetical protein
MNQIEKINTHQIIKNRLKNFTLNQINIILIASKNKYVEEIVSPIIWKKKKD